MLRLPRSMGDCEGGRGLVLVLPSLFKPEKPGPWGGAGLGMMGKGPRV